MQIFINPVATISLRRLGKKPYFYGLFTGKIKKSCHKIMNAVFRIMESKGIFHSANFQPCGISGNITSVGIVRITLFRHNADSGMSSEIGFSKQLFAQLSRSSMTIREEES